MRADRLLSMLMLLQARGRMTAKDLARQLEVSERTVYRDADALSAAGVPIYGEPGREGGFALLDSYRTSLTGMTDGELQALFTLSLPMLNIPGPLAQIELGQDLRAALLKLAAALPEGRRSLAGQDRLPIHIDSAPWDQVEEPVPYLQTLYQAARQAKRVRISYRPLFQIRLERMADPYGLVAKAGTWFLVYASQDRVRVLPFSRLIDAVPYEEVFTRPPDFDLAAFWENWCAARARGRAGYPVYVRVSPGMLPLLPMYFGPGIRERLDQAGATDRQGWVKLELNFESLEEARDRLLSFGSAVEVVSPRALRLSMVDYGEQITNLYQRRPLQE